MNRLFVPALALMALAAVVGSAWSNPTPVRSGSAISPDGVTIYASMRGEDDPTLVFIHGWSGNGRYWNAQMKHFAPRHWVVAIDLGGHGASHRNREHYTMEAFGGDIAAVLTEFQLDDVILIGHSMGGAVMVEATLAAPDRVIGLIGVDNFQDVDLSLTPEEIAETIDPLREHFRRATYQWVRTMFPTGSDSLLVIGIATDMAMAPSLVAMSALEEFLAWDGGPAAERVKALDVPLVCINSDFQPTDEDAMLALVPAYRLWTMPGVGRFPMLEDPDTFNRLLAEAVAYLKELDER